MMMESGFLLQAKKAVYFHNKFLRTKMYAAGVKEVTEILLDWEGRCTVTWQFYLYLMMVKRISKWVVAW